MRCSEVIDKADVKTEKRENPAPSTSNFLDKRGFSRTRFRLFQFFPRNFYGVSLVQASVTLISFGAWCAHIRN